MLPSDRLQLAFKAPRLIRTPVRHTQEVINGIICNNDTDEGEFVFTIATS